MVKNKIQLVALFLVLLFVSMACSFSASTANIQDAYLAADEEGTTPVKSFTQDQVFYAIVNMANAPDDTTLKATWYAVDAEGVEPNLMIDEVSLTGGDGVYPFSLENNDLWPLGTYKVDLWLNDKLDRTLEFTVE